MNVGSINTRRINAAVINGIPANAGIVLVNELADTLATQTQLLITAHAAVTEAADTLTTTTRLAINGAVNVKEVADSTDSAAFLPIQGTLLVTERADTFTIIGELPRRDVQPRLRTKREDRASRRILVTSERRAVAIPDQLRRTIVDPTGVRQPQTNFAAPHLGTAGHSLASLNSFSLNGLQINGARAA